MTRGLVIALIGAESTGKTTLAQQLVAALCADGLDAVLVAEHLRSWCDTHARTPLQLEQQGIAAEQTRLIDAAKQAHDIVVADTTALQIAAYSELVFGDHGLYAGAETWQRGVALTLLTAVDLPWRADGLREGPQVRAPVDAALRRSLGRARVAYGVVSGSGPDRLAGALAAVWHLLGRSATQAQVEGRRWQPLCERCGEAECERHLLPRSPD